MPAFGGHTEQIGYFVRTYVRAHLRSTEYSGVLHYIDEYLVDIMSVFFMGLLRGFSLTAAKVYNTVLINVMFYYPSVIYVYQITLTRQKTNGT